MKSIKNVCKVKNIGKVRRYGHDSHHHQSAEKIDKTFPLVKDKYIQQWAFQKEVMHKHWRPTHRSSAKALIVWGFGVPALFWLGLKTELVNKKLINIYIKIESFFFLFNTQMMLSFLPPLIYLFFFYKFISQKLIFPQSSNRII